MAYSFVKYTGDGVTKEFPVSFPYLRREHVYVYEDDIPVQFGWVNDGVIRLVSTPSAGATVRIARLTPRSSQLVRFTAPSILSEDNLNHSALQLLFILQEVLDVGIPPGLIPGIITEEYLDPSLGAKINTPAEVSESWLLLALAQGAWPEEFDENVAYDVYDYVDYDDDVYWCIVPTSIPSPLPTNQNHWRKASSLIQSLYNAHLLIQGVSGRVTNAEIAISELDAEIALRAYQIDVDGLTSRVNAAEIAIDGINAELTLKAYQVTVDELTTRVTNAEIDIDGIDAELALKASSATVDALTTRVATAEIEIDGLQGEIVLKAAQSELDNVSGALYVVQSEMALKPNAWTVKIDNGGNVVGMGIISYPEWVATASYKAGSYVYYDTKVYKALIDVPSGTTPVNSTYWEETTSSKSEINFVIDSFKVIKADGTGKIVPFEIGTVNGVSQIGINGNLLVDGSISATKVKTNELLIPESQITNQSTIWFKAYAAGKWDGAYAPWRGIWTKDGTRVKNGDIDWYPARSWNLAIFSRITKQFVFFETFDVYADVANADALQWYLESSGYANSNYIMVLITYDEPYSNFAPHSGLKNALRNIGASANALEQIQYRGSYALIGQPGIGEGNGIEGVDNQADSHVELPFTITSGTLDLSGTYAKYDPFSMQPPASGVTGLYLNKDRMGYYNATYGNWPVAIYADGRFYFGNPTQTRYIYWDNSSLTVRGTLYGEDIYAYSITTDKLYYSGLDGAVSYMATNYPGDVEVGQFSWTQIGTITVTPASEYSKFIIVASCYGQGSGYATFFNLAIARSGTIIASNSSYLNANCSTSVVDSPLTTSPVTYYIYAYGAYQVGDTWYSVSAKGIRIGVLEVKR